MEPTTFENNVKAIEFIEEITKNAGKIQKNVLAKILTQNADTEYLKGFNLQGATDQHSFKSKIPIITYQHLQPLIQRIANGDRSAILSAHPITELLSSSGTSAGEPKLIPVIAEDWERRLLGYSLLMPVINQYIKGLDKGKSLYFMLVRPERKTPGGLVAQPATTSYCKRYLSRIRPDDPYNVHTSPDEAILCADIFQSMYVQMLCGLYDREQVLRVGASFATGLLRAITFLQDNWQQLTHDIRTGSLNTKVTDMSIRQCMTQRPDPALADFIAQECAKDSWEGIITRIWANAKYIDAIATGTMAQYIPTLDYYSGGLPIACTRYVTSECFVGINLYPMSKPSQVSYTILPNMAYFEFLPIQTGSTHAVPVDLVDVKIGKEYELVVTTYSGLYRYSVGDILRVTGIYNSAPQFQFVRRKDTLLSIDAEKTDEVELHVAVNNASKLLRNFDTYVVDYTSYADMTKIPGHYVIFMELSSNSPGDELVKQCCIAMEESFNPIYHVMRSDGTIGPLEIRIVKGGTFEALGEFAISRGASIGQFKVPRCVSFVPILSLLDSRAVSTHFSPSWPRYHC